MAQDSGGVLSRSADCHWNFCLQDYVPGKSRDAQQQCLLSGSHSSVSFHLSLKPGASSALERPAPFSFRCHLFLCFQQDEWGGLMIWCC